MASPTLRHQELLEVAQLCTDDALTAPGRAKLANLKLISLRLNVGGEV